MKIKFDSWKNIKGHVLLYRNKIIVATDDTSSLIAKGLSHTKKYELVKDEV